MIIRVKDLAKEEWHNPLHHAHKVLYKQAPTTTVKLHDLFSLYWERRAAQFIEHRDVGWENWRSHIAQQGEWMRICSFTAETAPKSGVVNKQNLQYND